MLDDDVLAGIINLLMRIDANVQLLVEALTEEDGEDEGSDPLSGAQRLFAC